MTGVYGGDRALEDRMSNRRWHCVERAGAGWCTKWDAEVKDKGEVTYYDSVTGAPLFIAPRGRTWAEFEKESRAHGWPSFRDAEMGQENVRCLRDGECVSTTGTHLGHNLPARNGNRYCINLVSVAGHPEPER